MFDKLLNLKGQEKVETIILGIWRLKHQIFKTNWWTVECGWCFKYVNLMFWLTQSVKNF